jgi:hypothetical protein
MYLQWAEEIIDTHLKKYWLLCEEEKNCFIQQLKDERQ